MPSAEAKIVSYYTKLMAYEKVIFLIIVMASIITIYLCSVGLHKQDWDLETFKILLQFFIIVVIGGAITLLFSQSAKEREKREAQKEKYRKFQAELISEYNSAKRIRRILLAEARFVSNDGEIAIKAEPYRRQMQALINVQLRFEHLKRFIEKTDDNKLKQIEPFLKKIESYLNKVILEYQVNYIKISNNEVHPIDEFHCLGDFIKKDPKIMDSLNSN